MAPSRFAVTAQSGIVRSSWPRPIRPLCNRIGPIGAITATSLVLLPDQPGALLGIEVVAIGLVMVIAPIAFQSRALRLRKEATVRERVTRAATNEGFSLPFVIGGALLIAGARTGLYWIAAGDVLSLIAIVLSAWVLLIEILR
jgi:hypothetical protein